MTIFRLDAGSRDRTTVAASARPAAKPRNHWAPNTEPDTLLDCGCSIPWPVVQMVASTHHNVLCSDHGYQTISKTEIHRTQVAGRKAAKCQDTPDQMSILEIPPF